MSSETRRIDLVTVNPTTGRGPTKLPKPPTKSRKIIASAPRDFATHEGQFVELFIRCQERKANTVVFTADEAGRGTSTLAVNFARELALDTRINVLLLETNLRNPVMRRWFGIGSSPSMTESIVDDQGLRITVPAIRDGLHVLPAGEYATDPVTVYRSASFEELLSAARKSFDYVIVDAPPINTAPETRVLVSQSDAVVLVLESEQTRIDDARDAQLRIERSGGQLIGVVLNRYKEYIPKWLDRAL